jgi:RND family efflux transporter MFP subunit
MEHARMPPRVHISFSRLALVFGVAAAAGALVSCARDSKARVEKEQDDSVANVVTLGVIKVGTKTLERDLTLSSELVPFQEIDVYAKEAGYVTQLLVDYGTRVKAGQLMAVLEIPELQVQLKQDDAAIQNASKQATRIEHQLNSVEAQHKVLQLEFDRLDGVAKSKPGLVAQQEVDDAQGKALASEAQVEAAKANLEAAQSEFELATAKREHDQVLFDYSKITAPFDGVVTQRFANQGTLMQAGTSSSTQVLPLVRLSQDNLFRLVIPVPESYTRYIHIGDPVMVRVSSLDRSFPGKVTRFSVDVREDTRTMHTEVDVPNPSGILLPGMYAEATVTLEKRANAIALPLEALDQTNGQTTVDVVDPSNKIEQRRIALGMQTATDAEVLSGLHAGELVVVSDRSGLKPGQPVQTKVVSLMQYQSSEQQH